jgi:hypothetical protein
MKRRAAAGLVLLWVLTSSPASAACTDTSRSGTDVESLTRATQILESNGVDVAADYRVTRLVAYQTGGGMVWVKRLYNGLPVFRDELAFHFTANAQLRREGERPFIGGEGERLPADGIDTVPTVDADAAKARFAAEAKIIELTDATGRANGALVGPDFSQSLQDLEAELGIYEGELAWLVCAPEGGTPYGYFSGHTGTTLYFESGVVSEEPAVVD